MPSPSELPIPPGVAARLEPEEAQEASYLAASARISSFCWTFIIVFASGLDAQGTSSSVSLEANKR